MGKKKEKSMPMSMAGIMMGQDDLKDSPKLKPEWIIAGSLALVIIELFLKFFA